MNYKNLLTAIPFISLSIIASDYSLILQASLFLIGFGLFILGIINVDF